MRPWARTLAIYSPAIALSVAGAAVLLFLPLYTSPSGGCGPVLPPGVYNCPAGYAGTLNLTGPLLLISAGIYATAVFVISQILRGKVRPTRPMPART